MKRLPSVNDTKAAVTGYVDSIEVPRYRPAAMESRAAYVAVERRVWPGLRAAISTTAAAVVLIALAPAVVAQVQRVIQAFTIVNGRPAEVPVREVSLEQLRADMPFIVVPPVNIPAALHEEIDEVGSGSNGAQAMFQYSATGGPPVLTIMENSVADHSSEKLTMRYSSTGEMPSLPPPNLSPSAPSAPGTHAALFSGRNGMFARVSVTPITWEARGTRITLIAIPGSLDHLQLNAILRGMR